jgi:hypothetical protein
VADSGGANLELAMAGVRRQSKPEHRLAKMDGDLSPVASFEHRGFDTDCVLRQADSPERKLTDHTLTDRSRGVDVSQPWGKRNRPFPPGAVPSF